ncbi:MAG: hypothetical protein M3088_00735 [Actinomycetota bacterium]|nr:hypothetical protein [Actinomycetota bacterium]
MSASLHASFDGYRATFARYDTETLADHFAFPCLVVSGGDDIPLITVPSRDDWLGILEELLDAYRRLGVAGGSRSRLTSPT